MQVGRDEGGEKKGGRESQIPLRIIKARRHKQNFAYYFWGDHGPAKDSLWIHESQDKKSQPK